MFHIFHGAFDGVPNYWVSPETGLVKILTLMTKMNYLLEGNPIPFCSQMPVSDKRTSSRQKLSTILLD